MQRKLLFAIMTATLTIFLIQSCEKNKEPILNNEISLNKNEYFINEVKKELVVTDESGENSAFLAIYSDNLYNIETFINSHDVNLVTSINEYSKKVFASSNLDIDDTKKDKSNFNLEVQPKIYIEVVNTNLKKGITQYFLDIQAKIDKKAFVFGYPIGFITENNFIGAVHKGNGSEFLIQFRYKSIWSSFWKTYEEKNGVNSWFIPSSGHYWGSFSLSPSYKLQLVLYPEYYQTETNYRIAFQPSDMRGQYCTIGYYDDNACYVGTAPSGTTAFIYTYSSGQTYFMYSPVNGNQCPLAGSAFDGANCQYLHINNPSDAFLYYNNFYLKSDIIDDYQ